MNAWCETNVYFNPSTFDFKKQGITVQRLIDALTVRGLTPVATAGSRNKKQQLVQQLTDFLTSTHTGSGAGSGISSASLTSSSITLNQGFSLSSVVKEQADSEQFKNLVMHTGSAFDAGIAPVIDEGILIHKSVLVVEKSELKSGHFVIGSELSSSTCTADQIAGRLFYLFSLSKVNSDKSVHLHYVDFVTPGGKRPSSIIDANNALHFNVSANRLLIVSISSLLHDHFVSKYGSPRIEADIGTTDAAKLEGMRKHYDNLNGKTILTSIKAAEVSSRLLKTNMVRRMSDNSVLEYIRQTEEIIDIKLEVAWSKLISMGASWDNETTTKLISTSSLLKNTTRLRQIKTLDCILLSGVYVEFLTRGWCRDETDRFSYAGLNLSKFTKSNLSCIDTSKVILAEAVLNLEYFLIFCFGETYDEVTKALWKELQHGDLALTKYSSEYVRYEIESMLGSVFQIVKDSNSSSITTHDITTSTGVRAFIYDQLENVKTKVTIENQLIFVSTIRHTIPHLVPTVPIAVSIAAASQSHPTAPPVPPVQPAPNGGAPPKPTRPCKYFFFHQLGVTDKSSIPVQCTSTNCRYPHTMLSAITVGEAKGYLHSWKQFKGKNGKSKMPQALIDKVTEGIETAAKSSSFKR